MFSEPCRFSAIFGTRFTSHLHVSANGVGSQTLHAIRFSFLLADNTLMEARLLVRGSDIDTNYQDIRAFP